MAIYETQYEKDLIEGSGMSAVLDGSDRNYPDLYDSYALSSLQDSVFCDGVDPVY